MSLPKKKTKLEERKTVKKVVRIKNKKEVPPPETDKKLNSDFKLVEALEDFSTSSESSPPPLTKSVLTGKKIIHRHVLMASGSGLFPLPLVDAVFSTAVQARMVEQLARLYEVPLPVKDKKLLISSIIIGYSAGAASLYGAHSFLKLVPGIGMVAGGAIMPFTIGALTYLIGKNLLLHFEGGGNFSNFKIEKRPFEQEHV